MTGKAPAGDWPVRSGGSTGLVGSFGYTRDGGAEFHSGVDYEADVWAPVYAAHDGRIERAGFEIGKVDDDLVQVNDGYGSRIVLRSTHVETRYGHLVHQVMPKGVTVRAGELIGHVGRTGNVHSRNGMIPTHLHFEVRLWSGARYEPVNPEWWLAGQVGAKLGVAKTGLV